MRPSQNVELLYVRPQHGAFHLKAVQRLCKAEFRFQIPNRIFPLQLKEMHIYIMVVLIRMVTHGLIYFNGCHQERHYLKGLEGLRIVDLLEEVCHLGWTLRFQKSMPMPSPEYLPVSAYEPGCRTLRFFFNRIFACLLPCPLSWW